MKLQRNTILAAVSAVLVVGGAAGAFVVTRSVDVDGDQQYVAEQAAKEQVTAVDGAAANPASKDVGTEQYRGGHFGGARGGHYGRGYGGHPGWGYGRPGYGRSGHWGRWGGGRWYGGRWVDGPYYGYCDARYDACSRYWW